MKLLKGLQLFPVTFLIYDKFRVKISLNSKMSSMSYSMFNICNRAIDFIPWSYPVTTHTLDRIFLQGLAAPIWKKRAVLTASLHPSNFT